MRSLSPFRHADVRKVAGLRIAGASWAEVAQEMGVTPASARRTYEREVGDHLVEMSRNHNRVAARDLEGLPGGVVELLHDPADAEGVLAVLREPRRREVLGDLAACVIADPDMFVPWGKDTSLGPAVAICGDCPVRGECATDSLMAPMKMYGVWGGLSTRRRVQLQRALEAVGFAFPTTKRRSEKTRAA